MPSAKTLVLAIFMLSVAVAASAQEPHPEERHEMEVPYNVAALFLGNTNEQGANGFSLGLEYERRVSDLFGVGAVVEHAGGDINGTITIAVLYVHPYAGLLVVLGLGAEFKSASEEDGEEEAATSGLLGRIGLGYEFEFDHLVLVPQINLDVFEREEAVVVGAVIAYRF